MKITVKDSCGKKQEFTVEETDTIASIMNQVHERDGTKPDDPHYKLFLAFKGKRLPDGETGMLYI